MHGVGGERNDRLLVEAGDGFAGYDPALGTAFLCLDEL